ncbi:MAG: putative LPS assembly protein LptD, partial [Candidatus Neomarinimicrobiota bacterium]
MLRKYILLLIIAPLLLHADERLRLIQANVLENVIKNGAAVQILTGDVIFQKDKLILSCDLAHYTEKTGLGFLIGNAIAKNNSVTITADTLKFISPTDNLIASGNAHVWDTDFDLTSNSIIYFTKVDSGKAIGRAKLLQNNQEITADTLDYSKPLGKESAGYTAIGNVTITSDDRIITCGRAFYDLETEIAQLTNEPKIYSDEEVLYGNEIFAYFKKEELQYLFIPSGAKAYSIHQNKSLGEYKNDMTSKILKAYFVDGELDSMRLEGMATTLYHVFNDSIHDGVNVTSGDTISLQFTNQELQQIYISGGARGIYTPDTSNKSLDNIIRYSANNIDYQIPSETTHLIGNAQVDYTDMTLTAGFIGVNWQTNILEALPEVANDSTSREIKPTIKEGSQEPMYGEAMKYDLLTQRGKILNGKTKADDGYYTSSDIRNENKDIFYMQQSVYTTCDLDTPHFHFASPKLKMIHNDKVVAKPLTLYLAQIPIVSLPFAVLPQQKGGRQSGWLMPSYGTSRLRGHYLDGFGYYWAVNDYFDSKLLLSLADLQGIRLKLTNRYNVRYKYSGNLHLETRQYLSSGEKDISKIFGPRKKDYVVKWSHKQLLRRNQSLNVNASYYSNSDYNYITSLDPIKRMNQQTISNATYSKRWPKSNNSISINLSSTTDLMADRKIEIGSTFYQKPIKSGTKLSITTMTLPKFSLRHGQRPIFPTKSSDKSWYNNITLSYSSNFTNKNNSYYESIEDDTTGNFIWETDTNGDGIVNTKIDKLFTHSISFGAPQKLFRHISLNPTLSIKSDWVDEYFVAQLDSNGIYESVKTSGFATRTTGSFNLNMGTQLYGLFPIKIGNVIGLRHVASPSIGYSYTPDFSKQLLNHDLKYFTTITDSSGNEIQHDRFKGTLAGNTSQRERQSLNFSLNNVFQTKIIKGESERKIDLLSWRFSTNYNFAAEEFKLSNLNSSIRTGLSKSIKLDISLTHDFYKY